jgi:hypothetical protein
VGENLSVGTNYRFVLVASNKFGDSAFSEETRVIIGSLPLAPTGLAKVEEQSSIDSISVEWTRTIDSIVPVTGYRLYMDDGLNGELRVVFDGSGLPFATNFIVSNLTSGLPFRF